MASEKEIYPRSGSNINTLLIEECEALLQHLLSAGKTVPPAVVSYIDQLLKHNPDGFTTSEVKKLTEAHNVLSKLAAPAIPGTILFIQKESRKMNSLLFLGSTPVYQEANHRNSDFSDYTNRIQPFGASKYKCLTGRTIE